MSVWYKLWNMAKKRQDGTESKNTVVEEQKYPLSQNDIQKLRNALSESGDIVVEPALKMNSPDVKLSWIQRRLQLRAILRELTILHVELKVNLDSAKGKKDEALDSHVEECMLFIEDNVSIITDLMENLDRLIPEIEKIQHPVKMVKLKEQPIELSEENKKFLEDWSRGDYYPYRRNF